MERKETDVLKQVKIRKEGAIDYIIAGIVALVFFPFLLIAAIALLPGGNKCKHWRECPWYRRKDTICNKDGGMFYSYDKPGGCYYSMDTRKEELRQQNKRLRRLR